MTVAKIWNGSTWVIPSGWNRPRIWTGSAWASTDINFYNGAGTPSKTLTVGSSYDPGSKYNPASTVYGYGESSPSFGSISNTTLPYAWGAPRITFLAWMSGGYFDQNLLLYTQSYNQVYNGGWTSITVNGQTFTRAASSFLGGETGTGTGIYYGDWFWNAVANPFPADGTTINVTWNV